MNMTRVSPAWVATGSVALLNFLAPSAEWLAPTKLTGPWTAPCGVTVLDRADIWPVPTAFTAATWNWYDVPLVSPFTFRLVADAPASSSAPTCWLVLASTTRTLNPVICEPPSDPAVHATVADESPGVAVPMVGAPGVVAAVCWFCPPGVPAAACESAQFAPMLLSAVGSSSSSDCPVVGCGQSAPPYATESSSDPSARVSTSVSAADRWPE